MKKLLLTLTLAAFLGNVFAQSPDSFKYQAVVRDANGNIIANKQVGMQMTILQGSATGTQEYQETFAPTTNKYGLVNLEIGKGTVVAGDFSSIDWSKGPYFIETALDASGGTSYTVMGTSQLMSVPYALHATTAENVLNDNVDDADANPTNEIQALTISNDTIFLSNGGFVKLPATAVGFSGDYNDLTNIPTDIADGDDNTQLDSTQIAGMGFVAGSHTIDTDTKLTEAEVDAYVANNGYSTGAHTVDTDTHIDSAGITGLGFVAGPHTIDTDTKLTEAEVDAYVGNNGYSTGAHTVDTDTHIDSAGIAGLGFVAGPHTIDTDTKLTEAEVDTYVANNGYSTTDTTLDESEVDAMVANNGYLTTEVDGSVTNEIQALSISNDTIFLSNGGFVKLPDGGAFTTTSNVTSNSVGDYNNDDFVFGSPSLNNDGQIFHRARMYFDKSKGAFRAGHDGGTTRWDDVNVGAQSLAIGYNNQSSGNYSSSLGINNQSLGFASSTIGASNIATAQGSHAIGNVTNASGNQSISIGLYTNSLSYGETAIGINNTIYSPLSTTAINAGDRLFVIGNGTGTTSGTRSDALIILKSGDTEINGKLTIDPENGDSSSYTLPLKDGSANQVMTTDGSGNVSWSTSSGGAAEINDLNDGKTNTTSVFLGVDAGNSEDDAMGMYPNNHRNVAIGAYAFSKPVASDWNVAIGYYALSEGGGTGSSVAIGTNALRNATGYANVGIGELTLQNTTTGYANTAIGRNAMYDNVSGYSNVAIGHLALINPLAGGKIGNSNVAIGEEALRGAIGDNNVAIGDDALHGNAGSGNIAIGSGAGSGIYDSVSNKLYIENSSSTTPLIYGDFANDSVKVYGTVSVKDEYTLPATDGTANQVMTTDGSGNVSWQDASGGSSAVEAWQTPTLLNGNVDFWLGNYNPSGFYKDRGRVYMRGCINYSAGVLFVLPTGYRPPKNIRVLTYNGINIDIYTDGTVSASLTNIHGDSQALVWLENISFRLD